MTTQEINDTLRNKGFAARIDNGSVIVSLKRPVNTMEVWTALDYRVDQEHIFRTGPKVTVIGQDNG